MSVATKRDASDRSSLQPRGSSVALSRGGSKGFRPPIILCGLSDAGPCLVRPLEAGFWKSAAAHANTGPHQRLTDRRCRAEPNPVVDAIAYGRSGSARRLCSATTFERAGARAGRRLEHLTASTDPVPPPATVTVLRLWAYDACVPACQTVGRWRIWRGCCPQTYYGVARPIDRDPFTLSAVWCSFS